jgi:hypothetical protein
MHRTNETPIGEKWRKIADETRDKAQAMPPCQQRDDLLKKARQLDVAINLNNVLSSGTKLPK